MKFTETLDGMLWDEQDVNKHRCTWQLELFNKETKTQAEWTAYFDARKDFRLATVPDVYRYLKSSENDENNNDAVKRFNARWLRNALEQGIITGTQAEYKIGKFGDKICSFWHKKYPTFPSIGGNDVIYTSGITIIPKWEFIDFGKYTHELVYLKTLMATRDPDEDMFNLIGKITDESLTHPITIFSPGRILPAERGKEYPVKLKIQEDGSLSVFAYQHQDLRAHALGVLQ